MNRDIQQPKTEHIEQLERSAEVESAKFDQSDSKKIGRELDNEKLELIDNHSDTQDKVQEEEKSLEDYPDFDPNDMLPMEKEGLTEQEAKKIKDIVEPHYDQAREITHNATMKGVEGAEKDPTGTNFTDHNEEHTEQVKEKTSEALDASVQAIDEGKMEREGADGDVRFGSDVDYKVTEAAALAHDTGMSDHGYAFTFEKKQPLRNEAGNCIVNDQNPLDFNSVRDNHSANSALNVLANREQYKEVGFTDEQVDEISILTYSHSKSSSGIGNLNDSGSWKEGFDRMDALVDKYNEYHPDAKITFDRNQFEKNDDRLGALATESLALRVGDVSRDSGPDAPSQSGEIVHVDKSTITPEATSYNDEVKNAVVMRGDEPVENEKAKQVHIGEQNIVENHTEFKDGKLTHTITVEDGNHAPWCTAEAIKDHIGELKSAGNLNASVEIYFEDYNDKTKKSYLKAFEDYDCGTVEVQFPWNKGGR